MMVNGKKIVKIKINKPKQKIKNIIRTHKVIQIQIIHMMNKILIKIITHKIMIRIIMIKEIMIIIMTIVHKFCKYSHNKIVLDVKITSSFVELDNKLTYI